jgi:hypothetical protein
MNEPLLSPATLNYQVRERKYAFFLALFTVGLFNNNGYVMVAAGA